MPDDTSYDDMQNMFQKAQEQGKDYIKAASDWQEAHMEESEQAAKKFHSAAAHICAGVTMRDPRIMQYSDQLVQAVHLAFAVGYAQGNLEKSAHVEIPKAFLNMDKEEK
jgi:hypothetical protein